MTYEDYVAGGYFITMYAEPNRYPPSELLPPRVLSASQEISEHLPDYWAMGWGSQTDAERQQSVVLRLGASLETLHQIGEWVGAKWKSRELGWMDVFTSVSMAKEFLRTFFPQRHDLVLIGVGLHRDKVNEFLEYGTQENRRSIHSPVTGKYWEEGNSAYGVYDAIRRGNALEPGGEALGFELLGYSTGRFTSWLIHSLHTEFFEKLGIRPNAHGFLGTPEDALRGAEYVTKGNIGIEPGWWHSWFIVRYPIT